MKINKETIIYVLAPAYEKSGGPELLHQLVYYLKKNDYNCNIVYYGINEENRNYRNKAFDKYVDNYELISDIKDSNSNVIIVPEVKTDILNQYNNIKKMVWWLSIDNFFRINGIRIPLNKFKLIETIKLKKLVNVDCHLCQSNYAIDFLHKHGIENTAYLSDYLNSTFIENVKMYPKLRSNVVLYNPKKGIRFTKKLILSSKNLEWIPIENMTTKQVSKLLLNSKVYIDFGYHPGKDRFPREAAISGCCIITDKRGSAKYYKDIPILDKYKFEDKKSNIPMIINEIEECLNNYEEKAKDFQNYKELIISEEQKFEKDIKKIFAK